VSAVVTVPVDTAIVTL